MQNGRIRLRRLPSRPPDTPRTACASAASMTARGASVRSAAQSRKLERNPCGTAPILRALSRPANSKLGSTSPRADGNTNSDRGACALAPARISRARPDSGTRCSRRLFIRSAGIVHTPSSKSNSFQRAPRTSPDRQAVSTRNSNPSFTVSVSGRGEPAWKL